MTFGRWIYTFVEDYRAWLRGETRVAPRGVRGRVYMSKEDPTPTKPGNVIGAKSRFKISMTARVYRAAENRWYRVNLATGVQTPEEDLITPTVFGG